MESLKPSSSEFYAHQLHQSLKSGDFHTATLIHAQILKCGLNTSAYLMNNLLNFYAKMGSLSDAHNVFDEIPVRTTHCWNTLLSGYAKRGRFNEALTVFRAIPERDSVSWTTMIVGYNRSNRFDKAIKMFVRMISERVPISAFTATSILASCAAAGASSIGRKAHSFVVKSGLSGYATVANSLLNMYAKTGDLMKARAVFDGMRTRDVSSWNCMVSSLMQSGAFGAAISLFDTMEERNVVSWNTVIAGYNQRGFDAEALEFLAKMLKDCSLRPDRFTLTSALSACANTGKLQLGRQIHGCIVTAEIEASTAMGNALVSMYAKCGEVDIARRILVQSGANRLNLVAFTALLDGYVKLGDVNPAREIFDSLKDQDVVAWTAMIVGYLRNGLSDEALSLFRLMMTQGPKPNKFTFAAVLSAAAALACLDHGKQVHARAMRSGEALSVSVSNALITMYSKTGSIDAAKRVFESSSSTRDTVTWTSMILALAQHGLGEEAIELFDAMLARSIAPDHVTYVGVLSACTHVGLVEKGRSYYNTMINTHKIKPSLSHYSCMIDLLGRAGRLKEAFAFVSAMPTAPDAAAWGSLLSACKLHRDADLASVAAQRLLVAEPANSGAYATLANAYSACGKWEVSASVRKLMRDRGVKKERGLSWIRLRNVAHVFGAEDTCHPQKEAIYARVERLWREIKEMGFAPDLESVLHDLEDEAKEEILRHHSEKLAIAFGLINTPEGATLRVMKNLRVCGDCHSAIKFISKLERREIILRDATRFHHFKDGLCSCKDYW